MYIMVFSKNVNKTVKFLSVEIIVASPYFRRYLTVLYVFIMAVRLLYFFVK